MFLFQGFLKTFSTHPLLNIVFDVKMGQLHGKYVLNKRDIEYLSKHTQMTREDVQLTMVLYMISSGSPKDKLLQIFDIFDINGTGFISQLAMTKMVREMYNVIDISERPPGMNPISFSNFIFNDMDSNRDGQISKDEFIKACLDDESFSSILAVKLLESINSN